MSDINTPAPKYTGLTTTQSNDITNTIEAVEQYLPAKARIVIYPIVHVLSLIGITLSALAVTPHLDPLYLTVSGILEAAGASLAIANTNKAAS